MNQIEHDSNEPKIDRTTFKWWPLWLLVVFVWGVQLVQEGAESFDWGQIALGGLTAGVLVLWAIETTGNKVPDSWRRKPPPKTLSRLYLPRY